MAEAQKTSGEMIPKSVLLQTVGEGFQVPVENVFADDPDVLELDIGKVLDEGKGEDVRYVSEKICCEGVVGRKIAKNCFGQLAGGETTLLGGCTNWKKFRGN